MVIISILITFSVCGMYGSFLIYNKIKHGDVLETE